MHEPLHVNIRVDHAALERAALGQQHAVFRNQVVAGEHQVLRRVPEARVRIGVGAQQPRGLLPYQVAAVGGLTDDLIRRGQVDDHGRARLRQPRGGRFGYPQVLANLHAKREIRHRRAGEHLHTTEHSGLAQQLDRLHIQPRARRKVALLVKLGIIRDAVFGTSPSTAPRHSTAATLYSLH